APGALIVRSDEIRKRQHGVAPEVRLPPEAYGDAANRAVFDALAGRAYEAADGGQAVIADATFLEPPTRTVLERAARAAGVRFLGLWLVAPMEALVKRIEARPTDASDATVAVLRRAARSDPGAGEWLAVDASTEASALAAAREAVRVRLGAC
ncbi:MAG: AAA family ATPase, partial [Alphaproteobacteria bacterium]|nr:AAA family ATPase [Alphaproteobacteria bacterium]